jgi:hypothetical protein
MAVFTQELQAAHGCRIGRWDNGILLFVFADLAADTMQAWERWLFARLTELHMQARSERHFDDVRLVTHSTAIGLQTAIRVNQNIGVKLTRAAILAHDAPLLPAIRTAAQVIPGANARLFCDEAIAWLSKPFEKTRLA